MSKNKEIISRIKGLRYNEAANKRSPQVAKFGAWNIDLIKDVAYWSDAVYSVFDLTPQDNKSPSMEEFSKILHPDDVEKVKKAKIDCIANIEPYHCEYRIITKDGKIRHISSRGEILFNQAGEPSVLQGIITDITEQVSLKQAQNKIERRLHLTQRIAHIAYWSMDYINDKLTWSDEMFHIFDFDASKPITYQKYLEGIHPDDLDYLLDKIKRSKENKERYNPSYRIIRPNGEIRHISTEGIISFDDNGLALRMDGIVYDITEKVNADNVAKNMESRLLDAQRISHIGNWEHNLIDDSLYWSDEYFRICGLEPQQCVPSREVFKKIIHPDDYIKRMELFDKTVKSKKPFKTNYRIIRPSGEIRYISVHGEYIFKKGQEPHALQGTFHDITDQVITENKLKDTQDYLEKAQTIAHFGSWKWSIDNDHFEVSHESARILGLKKKHDYKTFDDFSRLFNQDERLKLQRLFKEAIKKQQKDYNTQLQIIRPDGEIRSLFCQAELQRNDDNWTTHLVGTLVDITERKNAELAAKISENHMLEAQRIAHLGNWYIDIPNDQTYWSDEIYRILDLEPQAIIPSNDYYNKFIHPDDYQSAINAFTKAVEKGDYFNLDHKIISAKGIIRHVNISGKSTLDDHGTPIHLEGIIHDITKRQTAEEHSKTSEAKLFEIIDIAPVAIFTTDSEMKITIFNKYAVEVFGYSADEIIDQHINILIPEQYRHDHNTRIDEFNNSGLRSKSMNERTGISGLRKNGQLFPATASVSYVGDGVNKVYTVILLDTTQRNKIEQERALILSNAQEANQAKTQFLATMSHELRTPLNAIIGFSEMMTNNIFGGMGSPKYQEYAGDIVGSSRHLLNLVNDILDLSEIESGEKNLNIEHLSLRDTLDDCQYIILKLADDKNIKSVFNIPADMPFIYADQRALKQIIINIMTNAVKFTPSGGEVELSAHVQNNLYIITIKDTGVGIPKDRINDIINPFSRVENDPYTSQEGKGLGLAIVKSLMSLHEGTLKVESVYGQGTTVTLSFPCKN